MDHRAGPEKGTTADVLTAIMKLHFPSVRRDDRAPECREITGPGWPGTWPELTPLPRPLHVLPGQTGSYTGAHLCPSRLPWLPRDST